ncbi:hypothetical protein MS2017_1292 [Bathymodiolus thermophilus thioautotrophic gill symbiont]|uniref:Sulfatase N-terminal domain-containing protein n=2 Tax=Bathymodiolus thermophilus thioautotrophic gill symbiont TaxID=2360 RepID=A0A3G3IMN8_9GAMM|nr:sulfatase-like hydrolase/transferase [Bathymodiolus thermophilus thioautotrophic gill symbiont]AYQ56988.1 hypothetical protein MS2017_1292 [Bathymodiolus thermophilus thioautotrophic gill symbiont]
MSLFTNFEAVLGMMGALLLIYFNLLLLCLANKTFKYYGVHIARFLTFSDWVFLFLLSILLAYAVAADNLVVKGLVFAITTAGAFALFVDALLFRLYSIELEPSSIKEFFVDRKIFIAQGKTQINLIIFNRISALLVTWLWFIVSLLFDQNIIWATTGFLAQSLFIIAKSRYKISVVLLGVVLLYPLYFFIDFFIEISYLYGVYIAVTLPILGFVLKLKYQYTEFFQNSNSFEHIIGANSMAIDDSVTFKPSDKLLLDVPINDTHSSSSFGLCKDANVLIISVESLGKKYIDYYNGPARFSIFDKLAKQGIVSKNHYCISANTDNALFHWYQGSRKNPYASLTKLSRYDTWFLTSQNIDSFGMKQLLSTSGFKNILDNKFIGAIKSQPTSNHWGGSDQVITQQGLDWFLEHRDQSSPFFMHILNAQTHVNYQVSNTKKYNRFSSGSYGRYLNAVEEGAEWVENIFEKLSNNGLLEDTVVVLCGDHGQSFGEFGYKVHSNAIIAEQILTPLVISHPKIKPKSVDISSHFDILPTIFDLLGVTDVCNAYGRSLLSDKAFSPIPLYTKTHRGSMPSSFGYVDMDKKILIDMIYKKISHLNHDDMPTRNLSAKDKQYYLNLAYRMLSNR